MKRVVSVVLAAFFIFSLAACTKKSEGDSGGIVGVWKYSPNEVVREAITDVLVDPGVYVDLYYEFYEDGTGVTYLSTDKTKVELTYSFDGEILTMTIEGQTFDTPVKLDGDILSVYDIENDEYLDMKRQ